MIAPSDFLFILIIIVAVFAALWTYLRVSKKSIREIKADNIMMLRLREALVYAVGIPVCISVYDGLSEMPSSLVVTSQVFFVGTAALMWWLIFRCHREMEKVIRKKDNEAIKKAGEKK